MPLNPGHRRMRTGAIFVWLELGGVVLLPPWIEESIAGHHHEHDFVDVHDRRTGDAVGPNGPAEYGSDAISMRSRRLRPASTVPASAPLGSGIDQANFDKRVRPQDDLFRAVNGTWLANTEIPADRSDYGVFGILAEKAENDLREIIEGCAAAKDNPPGSERQKVGDLYASFMDEARAEELGIRADRGAACGRGRRQDQGRSHSTLADLSKIGVSGPLDCGVDTDAKKSDEHILSISQSGMGLPDRDYYWDAKFKTKLAAYQAYIERMLTLAKIGDAKQAATEIVALESRIAKAQWSKVQNRDADKTYNKMGLAELAKLTPGLRLAALFPDAAASRMLRISSSRSRRTSRRWPSCSTKSRWRPGKSG